MRASGLMCRFLCCVLAMLSGARALAGELNPPPGPIAPTMKNLTQVEPRVAISAATTPGDANTVFNITQPGSYYLTGDVVVPAGFSSGIDVFAGRVTIDLNGFAIVGAPSTAVGILAEPGVVQLTVRNGHLTALGTGLFLTNATAAVVTEVTAADCTGVGIQTGPSASVSRCAARDCGIGGFVLLQGSVITHCSARECGGPGFLTNGQGVVFSECSAFSNTGNGFSASGLNSLVSSCVASNNIGNGFSIGSNSSIVGCVAGSNGAGTGDGAGIVITGSDNRIEGNNCLDNDRGIDANSGGNFITRNTCSGNTTNWDVAAGNVALVVNAAGGGAFTGNAGGAAPGSTDPNANFSY